MNVSMMWSIVFVVLSFFFISMTFLFVAMRRKERSQDIRQLYGVMSLVSIIFFFWSIVMMFIVMNHGGYI